MKSDDHETFQAYFAGIEARDLPALRHLLACPLCQQLARLLLNQALTSDARSGAGTAGRPRSRASFTRRTSS